MKHPYYNEDIAREKVLAAAHELSEKGLILRTWGNISARISEDAFVITPSGRDYDTLHPADLAVVRISDASCSGPYKASSERGVHLVTYRNHPEAAFVIHTHQPAASAVSILGRPVVLPASCPARIRSALGPVVPTASYGMNATRRIREAMDHAQRMEPAAASFLMKNHGALTYGQTMEEAMERAFLLEESMRHVYSILTGWPAEMLTPERIYDRTRIQPYDTSSRTFHLMAGAGTAVSPLSVQDVSPRSEDHQTLSENTSTPAGKISAPAESASVISDTPFLRMYATDKAWIPAYIDDFAQIVGPELTGPRRISDPFPFLSLQDDLPAVILPEKHAMLFTGKDSEDAVAAAMVTEKQCMALFLAGKAGHIPPVHRPFAMHDRITYVQSYSRLRE